MAYLKSVGLGCLLVWGLLLNQQAWAQKVTMVTTPWEPFFSANLPQGGVITEIATAAFEREGHQASIEWYPWVRALKLVEYGSADVVMGAYYSDERAQNYLYSDPIYDIEVGLMALSELGVDHYQELQDLKQYRIGTMRGWVYTDEFDNADFLDKRLIVNQVAAVRMLFANRIDLLAASVPVFKHEVSLLKDKVTAENIVLKPLLGKKQLYLMFSKVGGHTAQLVKSFNSGLAKIRADGTFDKILTKHGFD